MDFAVTVKGMDTDTARWVLAVDGDRFLITHEDKSLHWVKMADCTFARAGSPDQPRPVFAVPVQQQGSQLAVPKLVKGNHATRR